MQNYEKIKNYCLKHLNRVAYINENDTIYKQDLIDFIKDNGQKIKANSKRDDMIIQIFQNESLLEKFSNKYPFFYHINLYNILEFYELNIEEYEHLNSFYDKNYTFDEFKSQFSYSSNYSFKSLSAFKQDELKEKYKELTSGNSKKCHIVIRSNSVVEAEALLDHLKCFFDILHVDKKDILIQGKQIDANVKFIPTISKEEEEQKEKIEKLKNEILKNKKIYEILEKTIDSAQNLDDFSGLEILLNLKERNLLNEIYEQYNLHKSSVLDFVYLYENIDIIKFLEGDYLYENENYENIKKLYNEEHNFQFILDFILCEYCLNQQSLTDILHTNIDKVAYPQDFFGWDLDSYKQFINILEDNKKYYWVTIDWYHSKAELTFWTNRPELLKNEYGNLRWGVTQELHFLYSERTVCTKNVEFKKEFIPYVQENRCYLTTFLLKFLNILCSLNQITEAFNESISKIQNADNKDFSNGTDSLFSTNEDSETKETNKSSFFSIFNRKK